MPNLPVKVTLADIVRRAKSVIGEGVYKLGAGGRVPSAKKPFDKEGRSDCTGFASWCIGIDRYQPGRVNGDDWIETSAVFADAQEDGPLFLHVTAPLQPRPGDLIVYGDRYGVVNGRRKKIGEGHIGIIESVDLKGRADTVIDCASSRTNGAVNRRPASFFFGRGAIVVRFKGVVEP